MRVAVYDSQHFEMIHVIHNILDRDSIKVAFFTNKLIEEKIRNSKLGDKKFSTIIKEKYDNLNSFHQDCLNYIKSENIDLVIFNTIDYNYKEVWTFIKKINIPFVVTIHNINTWLKPPLTLNKTALKYYYYRHKIVSKSSGLILQEELFINYVKKHKLYKKPIAIVPHTLKESEREITETNKNLKIAIPGAIDGYNRRNYKFCLSAIEKTHKLNPNIEYVFLGKVKTKQGEEIYNKIKELKNNGCNVKQLYDEKSNTLFDSEMRSCDIVFMPVNISFKYEGIPETYGQTKVTGVLYDMMRFQKPGIIPDEYAVPPTMKSSIITYSSENDFITQILDLEKNREKLNQLINNAKENSEYYSADSIRNRVLPWFENITFN